MQESSHEEYHIATTGKRLGAFFIDDTITSILILIIYYDQAMSAFLHFQQNSDAMPLALFLSDITLSFVILKLIYQTLFVWQTGMTPGKMLVNIRIVEVETGQKPRLEVAFLRATFRAMSEMLLYVGHMLAYFNPLVQTLHDKVAKTVVIDA